MTDMNLLQKRERLGMLSAMRRNGTSIFLSIILSVLVVLTGCGGDSGSENHELGFDLPANVYVSKITGFVSERLVINVAKDDAEYSITLDADVEIYFDGELLELTSIQNGQELYLEGNSKGIIKTVIISEWPGMHKLDEPFVRTEPESVLGIISSYLETEHPELDISKETNWEHQEQIFSGLPKNQNAETYRFKKHIFIIKWTEHDYPVYNIIITPNLESPAIWSGRINEYGEVEELLYEYK